MPARAIGTATVSFGLVSIPVKLYAASEPGSAVSFNLLHQKDGSRLKQQYVCAKDGEIVPREEMVKGYEFAKDRYVTFTAEELKAIEEQSTQSIDIREFVPAAEIDPVYFDRAYYLGPDKGGDKAYRLLARAMGAAGRTAVGKYSARGKQYLVLLRPMNGAVVMQQLHYPNEVRSVSEVPIAEIDVKEPELKLALQLIEQISSEKFNPEEYHDEVRERVLALIQKKVDGEEITAAPAEETGKAQIIDLMEALKASLAAKPAKGERKPARHAPAAARAKRAASGKGGAES
jgi:DNA end-binding protein Ku